MILIYTKPNIAQVVIVGSQYMKNPTREYWNAIKRILSKIKGTSYVALCCRGSDSMINGYIDLDFVYDMDKSKSITSYVYTCKKSCKPSLKTTNSCIIYNISKTYDNNISL